VAKSGVNPNPKRPAGVEMAVSWSKSGDLQCFVSDRGGADECVSFWRGVMDHVGEHVPTASCLEVKAKPNPKPNPNPIPNPNPNPDLQAWVVGAGFTVGAGSATISSVSEGAAEFDEEKVMLRERECRQGLTINLTLIDKVVVLESPWARTKLDLERAVYVVNTWGATYI